MPLPMCSWPKAPGPDQYRRQRSRAAAHRPTGAGRVPAYPGRTQRAGFRRAGGLKETHHETHACPSRRGRRPRRRPPLAAGGHPRPDAGRRCARAARRLPRASRHPAGALHGRHGGRRGGALHRRQADGAVGHHRAGREQGRSRRRGGHARRAAGARRRTHGAVHRPALSLQHRNAADRAVRSAARLGRWRASPARCGCSPPAGRRRSPTWPN